MHSLRKIGFQLPSAATWRSFGDWSLAISNIPAVEKDLKYLRKIWLSRNIPSSSDVSSPACFRQIHNSKAHNFPVSTSRLRFTDSLLWFIRSPFHCDPSHTHLLVGEMCSHMHLFVRCVTTHICLWDLFLYTSDGGMQFCTQICIPALICWHHICWCDAFPYAFDGNMFPYTHQLARCVSALISVGKMHSCMYLKEYMITS